MRGIFSKEFGLITGVVVFVMIVTLFFVYIYKTGSENEQKIEISIPTLYLCSDETTITSDRSACPQIDMEYKKCFEMEADDSYYGDSPKDKCFFNLAVEREDISLCNKIESDYDYGTYSAQKCGVRIALLKRDVSECDALITSSAINGCYSEYASEMDDPAICKKIKSPSKRDDCLYNFISYGSTSGWDICEDFSEGSDKQDYCYFSAAQDTGELGFCDRISKITEASGSYYNYYSYTMTSCYATVAKTENDVSICGLLNNTASNDNCYYTYATTYPYDVDACENILDSTTKENCIANANYTDWYDYGGNLIID